MGYPVSSAGNPLKGLVQAEERAALLCARKKAV